MEINFKNVCPYQIDFRSGDDSFNMYVETLGGMVSKEMLIPCIDNYKTAKDEKSKLQITKHLRGLCFFLNEIIDTNTELYTFHARDIQSEVEIPFKSLGKLPRLFYCESENLIGFVYCAIYSSGHLRICSYLNGELTEMFLSKERSCFLSNHICNECDPSVEYCANDLLVCKIGCNRKFYCFDTCVDYVNWVLTQLKMEHSLNLMESACTAASIAPNKSKDVAENEAPAEDILPPSEQVQAGHKIINLTQMRLDG